MLCLVLCGLFYHRVSDDIGGFQNRLGEDGFRLRCIGLMLVSQACFSSHWPCLASRACRVLDYSPMNEYFSCGKGATSEP